MRVFTRYSALSTIIFLLGGCGCHGNSSTAASASASAPIISENTAGDCAISPLTAFAELPAITALPNPFVFSNGTPLTQKAQWPCRRAEIAAQVQGYELGIKPAAPAHVSGSISNEKITVTVSEPGKEISFDASIILPKTGSAPYPAIIGIGKSFLNNDALSQQGIAVIQFPNNLLGEQHNTQSRGKGLFYNIYGSDHSASAMTAWAWGVSRLIDVLQAPHNTLIDANHLGVTGCSRNGKGALVAGAFDERIALTIMQESGSGGAASWRISDAQLAAGQNVQTLRQIVTENVWFTEQFKIFSEAVNRLPFDHHSVMGLIAPRGLLVVENTSMEWLGNQSTYTTAVVAREIWKALGVAKNMGVSQVGGHDHCHLPASQQPYVDAFVRKFLIGDAQADTQVQQTDGEFPVEFSRWVDWSTPELTPAAD